jgi:hypothetical protein
MSYSLFSTEKITSTCSPLFSSLNCLTGNFKGHHSNNFAYLTQSSRYNTCASICATVNVDCIWKDSVVKLTGDHADRWIQHIVNLIPYKGNRVFFRFRGVIGSLFSSDICMDDFNVGQADITASDSRQGRITAAFDLVKMGSWLAFHVPEASASFAQVKIVLYNLQGRKVATLFSGRAGPGVNPIRLDASDHALDHGIYQCRMEAAGFAKTVAVMLR